MNIYLKNSEKIINKYLERLFILLRIIRLRVKIQKIKRNEPSLFRKIDVELENKHKKYWKTLFPNITTEWLRYYVNISEIPEYRYIPEDIYYAIIERRLNDINMSDHISNKCNYDIYYPNILFPYCFLKNSSGTFMDSSNKIITSLRAQEIFSSIKEDIVVKPSIESGGGTNVRKYIYSNGKHIDCNGNSTTLKIIVDLYQKNFVIQRVIKQYPFYENFNETSVNTFRVYTYRSVLDETVQVLNIVLRMGRKGSFCDNQRAGGISVGVDLKNGILNTYGINSITGTKYAHNPDSDQLFKGLQMHGFDKIIPFVKTVAAKIPSQRLLSFDLAFNKDDKIIVIEINTADMGINFLQVHGTPLFGNYTDEIVEYCKLQRDEFKYLRVK